MTLPEHMIDRLVLWVWYDAYRQAHTPTAAFNLLVDWCVREQFPLGAHLLPERSGYTAAVEGRGFCINGRPWVGCKLPV